MIAAVWLRGPARARLHALRELYRRFFGENTPDARGRRLLAEWLSPAQRAHPSSTGISMSSAAIPARPIASIMAPPPTSMRSTRPEMRRWGGASSRQAFVPGDVMLAQKIALETDERGALALANRFPPATHSEHFYRRPF